MISLYPEMSQEYQFTPSLTQESLACLKDLELNFFPSQTHPPNKIPVLSLQSFMSIYPSLSSPPIDTDPSQPKHLFKLSLQNFEYIVPWQQSRRKPVIKLASPYSNIPPGTMMTSNRYQEMI